MSRPIPEPGRPPMFQDVEPKQGHGCFFWGCTITLVLLIVLALVIGIPAYHFYSKAVGLVLPYTEESAVTLPTVQSSPERCAEITKRAEAFIQAVNEDKSAELTLTAEEINILISEHPDWQVLKGKVYAKIEGEEVKADVSIPLGEIPVVNWSPSLKRRYLNGTAGVKVSLQNGILLVTPETLIVKGKPIPEKEMAQLRKGNLARNLYKDTDKIEFISKLKSIEVKDGKLTVRK